MKKASSTPTLTPAERGRLGGLATAQRHGSIHMEAIGRAGFWATVERHFGGDKNAYMNNLRQHSVPGVYDPVLHCRVLKATPAA